MVSSKSITGFIFTGILSGLLFSCSATLKPNKFTDGKGTPKQGPKVSVTALRSLNKNGESSINVNISIDAENLTYRIKKRKLVAKSRIHLKIIDEANQRTVISKNYNTKVKRKLTSNMDAMGMLKINKKFNLPPGKYTIRISATDKNTGKKSISTTTTFIPDSNTSMPLLTDIQLSGFGPNSNRYKRLNTYSLKSKFDTLRFIVQISLPVEFDAPLQMTSSLFRFASDTIPARPMGAANYSESSLQFKGVNYYKKTEIKASDRKLTGTGNISVEFKYPALERGNYRFEVELEESSLSKKKYKKREFGLRSQHFPILKSPREKAKPLIYLMDDDEYEKLLSLHNSDAMLKAIDQFWYSNIENKSKAQEVKEQYYERVSIANEEFSNFKEGWKTDRGMVFILFGNPWILDKDLGKQTWFYSYNRFDESKTFTFLRTKVFNDSYPFHNYLLQRKFMYNNVLYQQKRLWLSGQIIDTQI